MCPFFFSKLVPFEISTFLLYLLYSFFFCSVIVHIVPPCFFFFTLTSGVCVVERASVYLFSASFLSLWIFLPPVFFFFLARLHGDFYLFFPIFFLRHIKSCYNFLSISSFFFFFRVCSAVFVHLHVVCFLVSWFGVVVTVAVAVVVTPLLLLFVCCFYLPERE